MTTYEQEEAKFVDAQIAGNLALMEADEVERVYDVDEWDNLTIDVAAVKSLQVSHIEVELVVDETLGGGRFRMFRSWIKRLKTFLHRRKG